MTKEATLPLTHHIRFGGVPEHFNMPWRLAVKDGVFDDLPVDWVEQYGGTGQMVQKLENGELDVAVLLTEGLIKAVVQKNIPAKIAQLYITSPLLWGIHTSAPRGFKNEDSLKSSARFAISRWGSGSHLMAFVLAKRWNVELTPDRFVVVGNLEGARAALKEGRAEILLWDRFMLAGLVKDRELARLGEVPTPWPSFSVAVRTDVWQRKREIVDETLHRLFAIAGGMKTRRGGSAEAVRSYGVLSADTAEWLATTKWVDSIYPDKALIDDVVKQLCEAGILEKKVAASSFYFARD